MNTLPAKKTIEQASPLVAAPEIARHGRIKRVLEILDSIEGGAL